MKQLCSSGGEMQGGLNPNSQISSPLPQIQNVNAHHHHQISSDHHQFDPSSPQHEDDFLEQMLSTIPSYSWPPPVLSDLHKSTESVDTEHESDHQFHNYVDSKLSGGAASPIPSSLVGKSATLALQQQLLLSTRGNAGGGDSNLILPSLPLSLSGGVTGDSSGVEGSSVQALFNGFAAGSLHGTPNQAQHFHQSQAQNLGAQAAAAAINQSPASGTASGPAAQPRQRVRARRGQATDPHSIAERLRRERIAERMKGLQELVPNANKTDKASMLDEIIDYVKFLQLQVKVLSMSRLGGAAAVAPLVAELSFSVGGGDCIQAGAGGNNGATGRTSNGGGGGVVARNGGSDNLTAATEQQVAKLMEEDMGSAMQYLQEKGLCLMPISLATAISAATCHHRSSSPASAHNNHYNGNATANTVLDGPSSPNVSVLSVQSTTTTTGNNGGTTTVVAATDSSASRP